jgi:hypothetical protein
MFYVFLQVWKIVCHVLKLYVHKYAAKTLVDAVWKQVFFKTQLGQVYFCEWNYVQEELLLKKHIATWETHVQDSSNVGCFTVYVITYCISVVIQGP